MGESEGVVVGVCVCGCAREDVLLRVSEALGEDFSPW